MSSLKSTRKHFLFRKNVVIFLSIVILSGVTIYYTSLQNRNHLEPYVMHLKEVDDDISCHYLEEGDALPSAEDPEFSPRPNSIFFHETSCRGGLNSRQACVLESAARAHPRRQVYLLFSAPVSELVLKRSCLAKLQLFPNLKIARVHIDEYAKKTPLEEMIARQPFADSPWWVEHTSDILRFVTLYKWGGVYLDTDMLVVKSLTPLGHNWVAKESVYMVSVAAIAISMDHLGRKLVKTLMSEVNSTYQPYIWSHNGPGAMTRALSKFCNTSIYPRTWSSETCGGLEVYESELFYPVHYTSKEKYFQAGNLTEGEHAYTHHLWNKLTFNMTIEKKSPFEKLAQKYCPTIYEMYGDDFGA